MNSKFFLYVNSKDVEYQLTHLLNEVVIRG